MGYKAAICKDCGTEIFVYVNMVMLKDNLWKEICDKEGDYICDHCIEERMGRKITKKDFKDSSMGLRVIPCNQMWLNYKKNL